MSQSYEKNFRKIAPLADLPDGQPTLFRAAGAIVVMLRRGGEVQAIDGSCLSEGGSGSGTARLARILDCVQDASQEDPAADWHSLAQREGLAARIEDGWVWVCIDGCSLD